MKKKLYIKRTAAVLSFVLAAGLILLFMQNYVLARFDSDSNRINGYYQEDNNSLDVVLLGSSECYADYSALQAYKEYGITSYPYCTQSNPASITKYQLKEVMRTQNPQLVVIEINGVTYGESRSTNSLPFVHIGLDNIPMNQNYIDAVNSVVDKDNRYEFWFPLINYHYTWEGIVGNSKWISSKIQTEFRGYSLLKGNTLKANTSLDGVNEDELLNPEQLLNDNKTAKLNVDAEMYLRDLLDYCKSEKLENVVFARFPHFIDSDSYERFKRCNKAGEIINSYGYDFVNFEKNMANLDIDKDTDMYNSEHMNIYGQQKFTRQLCNMFTEKYNVTPHTLTDSQKQEWDNCSKFYDDFLSYTKKATELKLKKQIAENSCVIDDINKYAQTGEFIFSSESTDDTDSK